MRICVWIVLHASLTRYVNLWVSHASGMPGTFSPPPRVCDLDMHHGTWVAHAPWCMPGLLTGGVFQVCGGENVLDLPGACTTHNFTRPLQYTFDTSIWVLHWPWKFYFTMTNRTKICLHGALKMLSSVFVSYVCHNLVLRRNSAPEIRQRFMVRFARHLRK